MSVPKAFHFSGDVAIVSGAGSRMPGEWVAHHPRFGRQQLPKLTIP